MKLRVRGVTRQDLEWNEVATPNVGDLMLVDGQFYVVLDRMWGVVTKDGEPAGWDLGVVVGPHQGPNQEAWVQ